MWALWRDGGAVGFGPLVDDVVNLVSRWRHRIGFHHGGVDVSTIFRRPVFPISSRISISRRPICTSFMSRFTPIFRGQVFQHHLRC